MSDEPEVEVTPEDGCDEGRGRSWQSVDVFVLCPECNGRAHLCRTCMDVGLIQR